MMDKRNHEMDEKKHKMDVKSFTREVNDEEYQLYFQCRAHYISADYYENLDRRLTYAKVGFTSLGAALGGKVYLQYTKRPNIPRVGTILCLASFGSAALTHLYSTQHDPARKQSLHNMAASQMSSLRKKIGTWKTTIPPEVKQTEQVSLLKQFYEFVDEHRKIEEGIVKSEDWTFTEAHKTLAPQWKERGEKLGEYFPQTSK